jgi:Spy/CpxP family protein refolding chaperone
MRRRLFALLPSAVVCSLGVAVFEVEHVFAQLPGAKEAKPGAASATPPANFAKAAYGSHLQAILASIQATPDQRKKIVEIVKDFRPKIEPLRVQYRQKQSQFLDAMIKGSAEDLMVRQEELNELYSQIINEYCAMHIKVRKLLNPQQCERYEDYRRGQGWVH